MPAKEKAEEETKEQKIEALKEKINALVAELEKLKADGSTA